MSELDIKEVHIVPVGSTGEVKDTDSKLDFYNSALVYLLNDKRSIYIGDLSISRTAFQAIIDTTARNTF